MSEAKRHSDALGIYLTGAASEGGAQSAQAASLGGYRSSSELTTRGHLAATPIAPVIVQRITPAVATGTGTLRVDADGKLRFTAPDDTEGAAVSVAAGADATVPSADTDQALRVVRRSSGSLVGAMSLDITPVFNSALAMSNVANAGRVAGLTTYRALMLRAHGAYGVLDVRVWIGAGTTQAAIRVGLEAPGAAGAIQTIADETVMPVGISWSSAASEAAGPHIGTLDVGKNYGLWIERAFPAGGNVSVAESIILGLSFWGA